MDDHDGCLFKSIEHRKALGAEPLVTLTPEEQGVSPENTAMSQKWDILSSETLAMSQEMSQDTAAAICTLLRQQPKMTTKKIAEALSISQRTVLRHLDRLKEAGAIRRVGPTKGGKWEVLG